MTSRARWFAEIAGVVTVAIAASLWWLPLGIGVIGVYLLVIGNTGGDNDARTEDRSS